MEIEFLDNALDDLEFWKKSGNRTIQLRIERLLKNICQTPYTGIGKPEPLKHELTGCWSRRITNEHRLIYTISENRVKVLSLRFHYTT